MEIPEQLKASFEQWFKRLQSLTETKLVAEHWAERWYDGYSPQEALDSGPDPDNSYRKER